MINNEINQDLAILEHQIKKAIEAFEDKHRRLIAVTDIRIERITVYASGGKTVLASVAIVAGVNR